MHESSKSTDASHGRETYRGDLQRRVNQVAVIDYAARIRAEVAAHAARSRGPAARGAGDDVDASDVHGSPHALLDPMFYPPHDARTESAKYKAVHKQMTVTQNLPCMVWGVTDGVVSEPALRADPAQNPYGATQMETHHHVIEWALANAIDVALFNRSLRPNLQASHPENADYQSDMTAEQVHDWVDHSPDNLWVLCDVHHRHKWLGATRSPSRCGSRRDS